MTFRLARLLRLRAIQEEITIGEATRANRDLAAARSTMGRRRDALAGSGFAGRGGELAFAAAVAARSASAGRFEESITLTEQAQDLSQVAGAQLAAARQRTRALERLEARHDAEATAAAARAEQLDLDEHAGRPVGAGVLTSTFGADTFTSDGPSTSGTSTATGRDLP